MNFERIIVISSGYMSLLLLGVMTIGSQWVINHISDEKNINSESTKNIINSLNGANERSLDWVR